MSHAPAQASSPEDRQDAVLRRLSFALRVIRMYPPASPIVDQALDEAHEALRPFLDPGPLQLAVYPESLGWAVGGGEEREHEVAELAARLHGRGVGWLRLHADLDRDALRALLEVLARRKAEEEEEEQEPILAGSLTGVDARRLELERLFERGGDAVESPADRVWYEIVHWFERSRQELDAEGLTTDPESLRHLVDWVLDADGHPPELASFSGADLLQLSLEQAASRWKEGPESGLGHLAGVLSDLYERIDPELWLEILGDPMPVASGGDADGEALDAGRALAAALSGSQVEELVVYGTTTRSRATPRLYRLFDRLLGGRDDRRSIAERVSHRLAHRRDPVLAEAWPRLLEMLRGEAPDPFIDSDYRVTLESGVALGDPKTSPAVRRRFDEMKPEAVRVSLARVTGALLSREQDPEILAAILETLERILPDVLRHGELSLVEELVSTLRDQAGDTTRPQEQRRAAEGVLETIKTPEAIAVLLARLDGRDADFYPLWRIVEGLGEACLSELLQALESHATPRVRHQLTRVLAKLPSLPLEQLRERLRAGQPTFTIQLMTALAGLGREELLPLFQEALEDDNPDVRRAAVQGLARLPDRAGEAGLITALDDPVLDVRVGALRAFRALLTADSEERLQVYLDLPNWHGRNTSRIRAAVLAARHFTGEETVRRLERLARKPLLFRRRRRPVWEAARQVLARLRRQGDLPYPSTGESTPDEADSVAA